MEQVLSLLSLVSYLLLMTLYCDHFEAATTTCKTNSTIQSKQQAIIDEVLSKPIETVIRGGRLVDDDDAEISYYFLGRNRCSLLIVITDGPTNLNWSRLIIWRERPEQKFINITDLVMMDNTDDILAVVQVPDEGDVDSLMFMALRWKNLDDEPYIYLSYTKDAGRTFQRRVVGPAHIWWFGNLRVSPSSIEHVILQHRHLTKDGGRNWQEISERDQATLISGFNLECFWVNTTMILVSAYLKTIDEQHGVKDLHRCDISDEKIKCSLLLHRVQKFVATGKVIVASVYDYNDQIAHRSLYTTIDMGDTWNRVQTPVIRQHHRPHVFLMSHTLSFITLLDEKEHCYDLFVSDSIHVAYSLSMKCWYQYNADSRVVEIHRLGNLPNTFVVNRYSGVRNDQVHIYVSRNNGGSWHMVQLKGFSSSNRFYYLGEIDDVGFHHYYQEIKNTNKNFRHLTKKLSSPLVPGVALFRIGTYKNKKSISVSAVTVDGGQSFFKVPAEATASNFMFFFSGDVLVNYASDNLLQLSFDRGHCWYNYTINKGLFKGEYPSCHKKCRTFYIPNLSENQDTILERIDFDLIEQHDPSTQRTYKELVILNYSFDVGRLKEEVPFCEEDNTHVQSEDVCVLGQKYHYQRPKQASETCRLHQTNSKTVSVPCECTYEDFECDFGFRPRSTDDGNNTNDETLICDVMNEKEFEQLSICYHQLYDKHEKYFNTTGYRKVVGSKCRESDVNAKIEARPQFQFKVLCEADDKVLKELRKPATRVESEKKFGFSFGTLFLISLFSFLVGVIIVAATTYLVKVENIRPTLDISFLQNFRSSETVSLKFSTLVDEM